MTHPHGIDPCTHVGHWTQAQNEDRNELTDRLRARGIQSWPGVYGTPLRWQTLDGLGFTIQALEQRVSHRVAIEAVMSVLRAGRLI